MPGKPHPITPEMRDEIDAAMEATGGVVTKAAKILKTKPPTLKNRILAETSLRMKWYPGEPTPDADIHRPLTKTAGEAKRDALTLETENLQRGFREMGFKDDDIKELAKMAQFTHGRLKEVTDLTAGGMANQSARLMLMFNKIHERVLQMSECPEKYNEYNEDEKGRKLAYSGWKKLKELMATMLEISSEIRKTDAAGREAMVMRYKIDEIENKLRENQREGKKVPGFGPPEVFGNPKFIQNNFYKGKEGMKDAKPE